MSEVEARRITHRGGGSIQWGYRRNDVHCAVGLLAVKSISGGEDPGVLKYV